MGSRYGVKHRKKFNEIRRKTTSAFVCAKCGKASVKHAGFALWNCRSCGATFAGGAYSPETMVGASARRVLRGEKKARVEEDLEEPVEASEAAEGDEGSKTSEEQ